MAQQQPQLYRQQPGQQEVPNPQLAHGHRQQALNKKPSLPQDHQLQQEVQQQLLRRLQPNQDDASTSDDVAAHVHLPGSLQVNNSGQPVSISHANLHHALSSRSLQGSKVLGRSSESARPQHLRQSGPTAQSARDTASRNAAEQVHSNQHRSAAVCIPEAIRHVQHHGDTRQDGLLDHAQQLNVQERKQSMVSSPSKRQADQRTAAVGGMPVSDASSSPDCGQKVLLSSPGKRKAAQDVQPQAEDDLVILLDSPSPVRHGTRPMHGASSNSDGQVSQGLAHIAGMQDKQGLLSAAATSQEVIDHDSLNATQPEAQGSNRSDGLQPPSQGKQLGARSHLLGSPSKR